MSTSPAHVRRRVAALTTVTGLLAVGGGMAVAGAGESTEEDRVAPAMEGGIEPAAPPLPEIAPVTVAIDGEVRPAPTPEPEPTPEVVRTWDTVASWYGPGFAGNLTANGETFDPAELTAAHKELPFGTRLRVTSLDTGRSVVVRINDRGPYIDGREIDLSRAAAEALGVASQGVADVHVDMLADEPEAASRGRQA